MIVSSRLRDRWGGGEQPLATQHRRQHVDSSPREREQGLGMQQPLRPLPEVVVAGGTGPHHRGLDGQVEDVPLAPVVALGAGGGCRSGGRDPGRPVPGRHGRRAALRHGIRTGSPTMAMNSHPGSGPCRTRFDDLRSLIAAECFADLPVVVLAPLVQSQQLVGQVADQLGDPLLAGQRDGLGLRGLDGLAATVPAPRTLRPASQAVSRLAPIRRRAAGVW
ncbi:MAG: hypothetical protein QOJ50_729 [Cryptosporangiaceae bacterium]|nr:hypothetical protein [Cryptosporangiaceae bacterium]